MHPALTPGRVAVVTGAASGIGLAAAKRYATLGLRVAIADIDDAALARAAAEITALGADVRTVRVDVSKQGDVERLRDVALEAWGGDIAVLMNNAAVSMPSGPWNDPDAFKTLMGINFFGVLHGQAAFVPAILAHGQPAVIVNTGSKQGITTPPGNAAYNVSKAALKVLTEQLAHELRQVAGTRVTAHLLVPGFTFTGMTGRTEKPAAAWTADQVVDELLARLDKGDFYILCPDNDVTRATDEKRIRWASDDIVKNRPALSRWHPDYSAEFTEYMRRDSWQRVYYNEHSSTIVEISDEQDS